MDGTKDISDEQVLMRRVYSNQTWELVLLVVADFHNEFCGRDYGLKDLST